MYMQIQFHGSCSTTFLILIHKASFLHCDQRANHSKVVSGLLLLKTLLPSSNGSAFVVGKIPGSLANDS